MNPHHINILNFAKIVFKHANYRSIMEKWGSLNNDGHLFDTIIIALLTRQSVSIGNY